MRIVAQRVTQASVTVDGEVVGSIGTGLALLVGIKSGDTDAICEKVAQKVIGWRLFPSAGSRSHFDQSVSDIGGEILVVSQFTLYGDLAKGRRPSLSEAAPPESAEPIYERLVELLRETGLKVATGKFGAIMEVSLINSGPATFIWDS